MSVGYGKDPGIWTSCCAVPLLQGPNFVWVAMVVFMGDVLPKGVRLFLGVRAG
jgi:hypothetical protein